MGDEQGFKLVRGFDCIEALIRRIVILSGGVLAAVEGSNSG